jgi:hypothetical protein
MHFPLMVESNAACMGLHWKAAMKTFTVREIELAFPAHSVEFRSQLTDCVACYESEDKPVQNIEGAGRNTLENSSVERQNGEFDESQD